MFKRFVMKKMLKAQLKGLPESQQEKLIAMIEQNPDLFTNIAKEVKQKTKEGLDQMSATMVVLQKHQKEIQEALKRAEQERT